MKKSIKLLVCILIAIFIISLNNGVYAKGLKDYEVLDIINYCIGREGEYPPEEVSIDLLEEWITKIDGYDKKDLINNYVQVSTQAKKVINGWLDKLEKRKEMLEMYETLIGRDPRRWADYFAGKETEKLQEWEDIMDEYKYNFSAGEEELYNAIKEELKNRGFKYDFIDIENEDSLNYWKPDPGSNDELTSLVGSFLGIIQVAGSVISVGALMIMGIKYMFGSVSDKAKYKESMIPYAIGCFMLFAITHIASAIYKFAIKL